jgi:nitrous oxidase accessory protein
MGDRGIEALACLAALLMLTVSYPATAVTFDVGPSESIQAAIDSAKNGDTLQVHGGVHRESLNVTKRLEMVGVNRPVVDAKSNISGIVLQADGIVISGFKVDRAKGSGIKILSSGNAIMENEITNCTDGIFLASSMNNTIRANVVKDNVNGIVLERSANNTIEANEVKDNNLQQDSDCGISLESSDGNVILRNNATNNGDCSISLKSSSENVLAGNRASQNRWYGISLSGQSNDNLLEGNSANANRQEAYTWTAPGGTW